MINIRKFAKGEWEWKGVDAALDAEVQRREEEIRFQARELLRQEEFIKNLKAEALKAAEEERSARIRSLEENPVETIDMPF